MRENPENRLGTSPRNVGKILNVQKPTTKKDLRGLIGLVNFYGKSIPSRAEILEPLTRNEVNWKEIFSAPGLGFRTR